MQNDPRFPTQSPLPADPSHANPDSATGRLLGGSRGFAGHTSPDAARWHAPAEPSLRPTLEDFTDNGL